MKGGKGNETVNKYRKFGHCKCCRKLGNTSRPYSGSKVTDCIFRKAADNVRTFVICFFLFHYKKGDGNFFLGSLEVGTCFRGVLKSGND